MTEQNSTFPDPTGPAAADPGKLIPEWNVDKDDQVMIAGLFVLLLLVGGLVASRWTGDEAADTAPGVEELSSGGSGDDLEALAAPLLANDEDAEADDADTDIDEAGDGDDSASGADGEADDEPVETAPAATTPAETTPDEPVEDDEAAVELEPSVTASVASFARVDGTVDGTTAVLTGYVDTAADSDTAEADAAAVEGITDVDNQLVVVAPAVDGALSSSSGVTSTVTDGAVVLTGFVDTDDVAAAAVTATEAVDGVVSVDDQLVPIQPAAVAALEGAGVSDADAVATDLVVVARGELAEESDRQGALDAVAAVEGVAEVTDELTVALPDVSESLNALVELEPVQFATSSPVVLESSFPTLDRAAEIILNADVSGTIEVQGYTDIRGSEASNLTLSQGRAAAVVEYLVNAGVAPEQLTSAGFGGTTQFGEGDSDEALAANRRVVFVLNDAS